jgi:hypothetical protein
VLAEWARGSECDLETAFRNINNQSPGWDKEGILSKIEAQVTAKTSRLKLITADLVAARLWLSPNFHLSVLALVVVTSGDLATNAKHNLTWSEMFSTRPGWIFTARTGTTDTTKSLTIHTYIHTYIHGFLSSQQPCATNCSEWI